MSLSSLLGDWAELEPERCKQHKPDVAGSRRWELVKFGMNVPLHEVTLGTRLADIQVAVQGAIEAHGWYWCIDYLPWDDKGLRHNAGVKPDRDTSFSGCADSPAVALLQAYVSALRAAKETDG